MSDWNSSALVTALPRHDRLPQTIADRTRRVYDVISAVYPASTFFFHSRAHTKALEMARIADGSRVLEIATGSGEMFRRLIQANPNGTTYGLDLSPRMAARTQAHARRMFPGVRASCGAVDVRHMPFARGSFDAVMCCFLLELLGQEDIFATLREIRRVLRPGGRFTLALIGQYRPGFRRAYYVAGSLVPSFWGRLIESEADSYLGDADLRVLDSAYVQQGFYPSRVVVAE